MVETAFDTHREFQRLRDAGFENNKAEAIIYSVNAAVTGGVATKADFNELKKDIKRLEENFKENGATKVEIGEIWTAIRELQREVVELQKEVAELKKDVDEIKREVGDLKGQIGEIRAEIAQSSIRSTRWMIGTAIGLAGVIIAYLQFFFLETA